MKLHEFYSKYANVPLDKRFTILHITKLMVLANFYKKIQKLDDRMRPMRIEMEKLLSDVEPFLEKEKK